MRDPTSAVVNTLDRLVLRSRPFLVATGLLMSMAAGCTLPGECRVQGPGVRAEGAGTNSALDFGHTPLDSRPQHETDRPHKYRFKDDVRQFFPLLKEDARGVANWNNAAILGAALAGAIGIHQDLDDEVRENTARHPERWGQGSEALGYLGEVQYQTPVLLGIYAYSLHRQDAELRDLSGSLISAYTLTGLSTVAIKGIANTDRPTDDWNGGQFGFPSFHASSSFSIAAVLDEYYGAKVGMPAYALAGLIGWSRIDERDHDLSDVVFGAALGYVVGKSVAGRHLRGDSRVRLLPYVHPTEGSGGLMLDLSF